MFAKKDKFMRASQHDHIKRSKGEMFLVKIHKSSFKCLHIAHSIHSPAQKSLLHLHKYIKWKCLPAECERCLINTFIFNHFPFLMHSLIDLCCKCNSFTLACNDASIVRELSVGTRFMLILKPFRVMNWSYLRELFYAHLEVEKKFLIFLIKNCLKDNILLKFMSEFYFIFSSIIN